MHTRVPSNSSNGHRNGSSTSIASAISSIRAPSRQHGLRNNITAPFARPPSAADYGESVEEDVEAETSLMGKRKGTSHTPVLSFRPRKTRTNADLRSHSPSKSAGRILSASSQHSASYILRSDTDDDVGSEASTSRSTSASTSTSTSTSSFQQQGQAPSRAVSLTAAFSHLSLTPRKSSASSSKHRPSLSLIAEEPQPTQPSLSPNKIPKFSCTPQLLGHTQSTQLLRTPSPLKPKPSLPALRTPVSTRRNDEAGIPIYLTKEKLTPTPSAILAWDTKGRLEDMEKMFSSMRTQMATAADSKTALEESLGLYKMRGEQVITRLRL